LISEWIISLLGLFLLLIAKNVSLFLSGRVQKICGCRSRLDKLVGCDLRKLRLSNSERLHILLLRYCLSCR